MDSASTSAYYVSNGYLVLTPDIVYTIGYPGQSALKCVLAGVNAVAARGFVDEKNIGIQGHSWGGYQIAYMVTQTDALQGGGGRRARRQHDLRIRRHTLGSGAAAAVSV